MNEALLEQIKSAVDNFCCWFDRYGETSYDQQGFYASEFGQTVKALYYRRPVLGTFAVFPMVFCEALFPSARKRFSKPRRFPIADAHFAMAFAFLAQCYREERYYKRAIHFLNVLSDTRSPDCIGYGWGYPFNWQTRTGVIAEGTPLITTVPYVYEAFSHVYAIDGNGKWLDIMHAIAEHAFASYRDLQTGTDAASCAYTPAQDDPCGVINASAYRAFLLTKAGLELSNSRYLEVARRNLNFVLQSQNPDGSWCYSVDGQRDFIDHFHTCFVLKALAKINELMGGNQCTNAIKRGVAYYITNLFDESGLPVPFSKRPRLTVYRRELYDYAECINLCILLAGRFAELDGTLPTVLTDLLAHWRKSDGSFRSRKLIVGWDNVPMHRWAQAQTFRSLSFLLSRSLDKSDERVASTSTCLGAL